MKYTTIILIALLLTGCTNKEKVFQKAKTNNGKFELYFYMPTRYLKYQVPEMTDKNLIKGFKIDNNNVVKDILDSWRFPVIDKGKSNPRYILEISRNNETYTNRWLNKDLTIIMGKQEFKFDKKDLFKYRPYFKPIVANTIIIKNLSDARRFIEILKKNKGYLPFHNKNILYQWEKYSGLIELEYPNKKLPEFKSSKDINRFLQEKFSKISKVEMESWNEQGRDKNTTFKIFTEKDISNRIPENFMIKSKWKELSNLKILVFNLTKDEIVKLARKNMIDIVKIENVK